MPKCIVGIDPGVAGGVAVTTSPTTIHTCFSIPYWKPKTKRIVQPFDFMALLYLALQQASISRNSTNGEVEFIIEEVAALRGVGTGTTFQFGRSLGAVEALAGTLGCPMFWVPPRRWKEALSVGRDKKEAMDRATAIFGTAARDQYWNLRKNDGNAEAALMAHYHWTRS